MKPTFIATSNRARLFPRRPESGPHYRAGPWASQGAATAEGPAPWTRQAISGAGHSPAARAFRQIYQIYRHRLSGASRNPEKRWLGPGLRRGDEAARSHLRDTRLGCSEQSSFPATVSPAKAGIQRSAGWVPAFAGVTKRLGATYETPDWAAPNNPPSPPRASLRRKPESRKPRIPRRRLPGPGLRRGDGPGFKPSTRKCARAAATSGSGPEPRVPPRDV